MSGVYAFGAWLFRYRNGVFPGVLLGLFTIFPPQLFGGTQRADLLLDSVGILIAVSGQALRFAVVGLAYIKRGGMNKQVYASSLVTDGLFAHSRNPLYVGNLLILAGIFIIHNHPLATLGGALFFGFGYYAIVKTEERFLSTKFGDDYRAYCARVPCWLPRWQGIFATIAGMQFNWRRVCSKELASFLVWALAVVGLLASEAMRTGGMSSPREITLSACALALAVGFVLLGVAKKQGAFAEPAV